MNSPIAFSAHCIVLHMRDRAGTRKPTLEQKRGKSQVKEKLLQNVLLFWGIHTVGQLSLKGNPSSGFHELPSCFDQEIQAELWSPID